MDNERRQINYTFEVKRESLNCIYNRLLITINRDDSNETFKLFEQRDELSNKEFKTLINSTGGIFMKDLLNSLNEVDKYIEDNDILTIKLYDSVSGNWQYILALEDESKEAISILFNKSFLIEKCQLVPNNRDLFKEILLNYKYDISKYSQFREGKGRFSKDKALHSNLKPYLEI